MGNHTAAHAVSTKGNLARVGLLAIAVLAIMLFASFPVEAQTDSPPLAQTQAPYEAPDIEQVDLPGWAEPFEPLARLPLWAQAAVVSAGLAGLFFVVPVVSRWVWSLGGDSERTGDDR